MRGDLWTGDHRDQRRGAAHPGRRRRRLLGWLRLPQGHDPGPPPRGPRPAPHPVGAHRHRRPRRPDLRGDHLGRGLRSGRRRARCRVGGGRPERRRDVPGQPQRPHAGREHLQPPADPGGRHPEPLLGQHGRPDAQARVGRADVRQSQHDPGPRPGPDRLPAHAGRESVGVQRQPLHGAGLPGPARSAEGAGRSAGRRRSPAEPDSEGGRRARPDPPRRRRGVAVLAAARAGPRRPDHPRAPGRPRRRCRSAGRCGPAVLARGRRRRHPDRTRRDRTDRPRTGRRADGGRLRPDRHPHRPLRNRRIVGRRCDQHGDREPRRTGRRHVRAVGHGAPRPRCTGGPRVLAGPVAQPGPRSARSPRRTTGRHPARRDPHRRTGTGARPHHRGGQPCAVVPGLTAHGGGTRLTRLHGVGRHLPQRDHPVRRRHPPRTVGPGAQSLRPGLRHARRPQRGQLVAAGLHHRCAVRERRPRPTGADPERRRCRRRPRGRPRSGHRHGAHDRGRSTRLGGRRTRSCRAAGPARRRHTRGSRRRCDAPPRTVRRRVRCVP